MKTMRNALLTFVVAALAAGSLPAQSTDDWREDLRVLATELPKRHPNAFAKVTREQWDAAVKALDARLPQLKRHEVIVEFMRIVAMVGDGHTAFAPEFDERIGFHRFPVQLYDFADGLYIVSADSANAGIVGAKVVTIGPSSAAAAIQTVGRVISRESPNWIRARAGSLLAIPEVLAALGMGKDTLTAEFGLEIAGKPRTVTLRGTQSAAGNAHGAAGHQVDMRRSTPGEDPLWQRMPGLIWWFRITPDSVLYINHRAVAPVADGESNEQFFRRAFAAGDSARVARVVLDIRTNGGGNNFMNRHVVKEVIRRPNLDQPGRLLVLIGRGTFSAAQNLVNELDYYTNATFVGEPTGNAPNQYGDARPLALPRTGFVVRVSSLLWQSHQAADNRAWFPPDIYAEMSSEDYRTKNDPVLSTALRRATGSSLAKRLGSAAELGDTADVRRAISSYRNNDENKFRNIEADVNSAGYELLRDGKTDAAVMVLRVNSVLFPTSGNAFDSLGEALEKAGKTEEAIATYRKALALDARLFSSRDALRRLGATP
jgi:hypothetical protein